MEEAESAPLSFVPSCILAWLVKGGQTIALTATLGCHAIGWGFPCCHSSRAF